MKKFINFALCFFISTFRCDIEKKEDFELYKQRTINFFESRIDKYKADWEFTIKELNKLVPSIKIKENKNDICITNESNHDISMQQFINLIEEQETFIKWEIFSLINKLKRIVYKKNINKKIKNATIQHAINKHQLETAIYLYKFEKDLTFYIKHLIYCPCDKFCDESEKKYKNEEILKATSKKYTTNDRESIKKFDLLRSITKEEDLEILKYIFFHEFLENFITLIEPEPNPDIPSNYSQLNNTSKNYNIATTKCFDQYFEFLKNFPKNYNITTTKYFDRYFEFLENLNKRSKYQILCYDFPNNEQTNKNEQTFHKFYDTERSQSINNFIDELVEKYLYENCESIIKDSNPILFLRYKNDCSSHEFKNYSQLINKIFNDDNQMQSNKNNTIIKNYTDTNLNENFLKVSKLSNNENKKCNTSTDNKKIKITIGITLVLSVSILFYYYQHKLKTISHIY